MPNPIEFTTHNNIGLLRVNRPGARNALNWQAQETFAQTIHTLHHTPTNPLRALIITGTGHRAFVSGGDLKELAQDTTAPAGQKLSTHMPQALQQLSQLPYPTIAAINGDAYGGGCEILTACDLRIAAAHSHLGFVQVKNSLTTGWGGTARLVRLIGQSRAMELLLSGRVITATEAHQIGLIHRIVPAGQDLLTAAHHWANQLITLPHNALAALKTLIHASSTLPLHQAYQLETIHFRQIYGSPNHREALTAFTQKRPPIFNQTPDTKHLTPDT